MSTTVTCGTASRNYSTVGAAMAAFVSGGYIIECYNDSEFVSETFPLQFIQTVGSSADFLTIRPASGQGFGDNANKLTNALDYNVANGVGINSATNYAALTDIRSDYTTIEAIQFKATGFSAGTEGIKCTTNATPNVVLSKLLIDMNYCHDGKPALQLKGGLAKNCLSIVRSTSGGGAWCLVSSYTSSTAINCGMALTSNNTPSGFGSVSLGATLTMKNCWWFGWATGTFGTNAGSNNASDLAIGFGTSNQASKTYANQFQDSTSAGSDFRLKTGSDCIDNGVTDTTDIPAADDIVGTSRPKGSAWDIGPWEFQTVVADTIMAQSIF